MRVLQYPDGALAIFDGPRRLADYTSAGLLVTQQAPAQSAA